MGTCQEDPPISDLELPGLCGIDFRFACGSTLKAQLGTLARALRGAGIKVIAPAELNRVVANTVVKSQIVKATHIYQTRYRSLFRLMISGKKKKENYNNFASILFGSSAPYLQAVFTILHWLSRTRTTIQGSTWLFHQYWATYISTLSIQP
jgi:hypothetical protein